MSWAYMNKHITGIIAGTPVDTRMGAEFAAKLGWRCLEFAVSRSAQEQNELQTLHPRTLQTLVEQAIDQMVAQGAKSIVIYCHSLSSVLDRDRLRRQMKVPIVMPLDSYRNIARRYDRLAVFAANEVGLQGANLVLRRENPRIAITGAHSLSTVREIEAGRAAAEIAASALVQDFFAQAKAADAQALLLACTHFPYLTDVLRAQVAVPVHDINEELAALLTGT